MKTLFDRLAELEPDIVAAENTLRERVAKKITPAAASERAKRGWDKRGRGQHQPTETVYQRQAHWQQEVKQNGFHVSVDQPSAAFKRTFLPTGGVISAKVDFLNRWSVEQRGERTIYGQAANPAEALSAVEAEYAKRVKALMPARPDGVSPAVSAVHDAADKNAQKWGRSFGANQTEIHHYKDGSTVLINSRSAGNFTRDEDGDITLSDKARGIAKGFAADLPAGTAIRVGALDEGKGIEINLEHRGQR